MLSLYAAFCVVLLVERALYLSGFATALGYIVLLVIDRHAPGAGAGAVLAWLASVFAAPALGVAAFALFPIVLGAVMHSLVFGVAPAWLARLFAPAACAFHAFRPPARAPALRDAVSVWTATPRGPVWRSRRPRL